MIFSLTVFRTQEIRWVFYLSQIFTDEQKPFCEQGEQAEKNWPLPRPLPRREGRGHRDTPMANHQHPTLNTQHPSETLPHALLRMEKVAITEDIFLRCLCCDGLSLDYRDGYKDERQND